MYSGISKSSGNPREEFKISFSFTEDEEEEAEEEEAEEEEAEEEDEEDEEEGEEEVEWEHFLYISMYALASLSREA